MKVLQIFHATTQLSRKLRWLQVGPRKNVHHQVDLVQKLFTFTLYEFVQNNAHKIESYDWHYA